MKALLMKALISIMFLTGILLLFSNSLQNKAIENGSEKLLENDFTEDSEDIEASFDFQEVQSLNMQDVIQAQLKRKDFKVIGSIAIPDVSLELPIGKGVAEYIIALGAGTMKPDQQLGQGNYALASHYFDGKDILFGPLHDIELGSIAYVSDLHRIYEYKITVKETILDSSVHVIYDTPDQTLLTLITCAEQGTKRLLVQGELVKSYPINKT